MSDFEQLTVGGPYPHAIAEGMTAIIEPAEEAPTIRLICGMTRPNKVERQALTKQPIKLGLVASSPLVWFVLWADRCSFDAAFAVGIYPGDGGAQRLASVQQSATWTDNQRQIIQIDGVDRSNGTIFALRLVTVSRDWVRSLATALERCPLRLDSAAYRNAMARDMSRWPSTERLLRDATIVEVGGAV